jgi:hypothetical protein
MNQKNRVEAAKLQELSSVPSSSEITYMLGHCQQTDVPEVHIYTYTNTYKPMNVQIKDAHV